MYINMNLDSKRGVSGVVTAVLLILLVIAAIGILWVVIQNFVEEGTSSLGGSADCLETSFEVLSSTTSSVTIRRTSGDAALSAITVAVDSSSGTVDQDAVVGESVTVSITPILSSGNYDVSVSATLSDGTACPLISVGSITI